MSPTAGVEKKSLFLIISILEKKNKITYSLKNTKNVFHILGNLQCIPYFISDYYILKIFVIVNHNNSCSLLTKSKGTITQTFFQQYAGFWSCWKYLGDRNRYPKAFFRIKWEIFCRSKQMPKTTYTKFQSFFTFSLVSLEDIHCMTHIPLFLSS